MASGDPSESLEGAGLLREYDGEFGFLLWQTVRDVALWAEAPKTARGMLFAQRGVAARTAVVHRAAVPERIVGPMTNVGELLHAEPEHVDPDFLSLACMEIARWARQAGSRNTAFAYAQAAALASPGFADAALLAGICATEAKQPSRAEAWLRRAVAVARRGRYGEAFASGFYLLGNLAEVQGNAVRAEQYYRRAFREGRRRQVRLVRRDAAYALFRLARDRGDLPGAFRFAMTAERAHNVNQPNAPALLLDLGRFWTEFNDERRARSLVRRLIAHFDELTPSAALAIVGLAARVQAGTEPRNARNAAARTLALLDAAAADDRVAFQAALDVAHGAAARRDRKSFDRAVRFVHRNAPAAEYARAREGLAKLADEAFPPE